HRMCRRTGLLALVLAALAGTSVLAAPPSRILWGLDGAQNHATSLYRIDPATGAGTLVGAFGAVSFTGIALDPTSGTLYGASSSGTHALVTIDRATAATTSIGALTSNANLTDIAFAPSGQLFGWWDGTGGPKDLVAVDKTSGALAVVGDSMLATIV